MKYLFEPLFLPLCFEYFLNKNFFFRIVTRFKNFPYDLFCYIENR